MLTKAKRDTRYRKEKVHRDEIAIQNEDDDSGDSERVTETENQEEGRHSNINDGSEEEEKDDQANKKAKASEVAIQFRNIGAIREAHIVCFCDASFRNLKGESSQRAHVIFLNPIRSGGGL